MVSVSVSSLYRIPPPPGTPLTDPAWEAFFRAQWEQTGLNGGTFEEIHIVGAATEATISGDDLENDLIDLDKGLYINYSTNISTIAYGIAINLERSSGQLLTVGAQINAKAGRDCNTGTFGIACEAWAEAGCNGYLVGHEASTVCLEPSNLKQKLGFSSVFKNRPDGYTTAPGGLGANMYNYTAWAYQLDAQPRSSAGEYCGWAVGMQFLSGCFDQFTPRAWDSTVTYEPGEVVTSAGLAWKAIVESTNQTPAVPSSYWVQHTYSSTVCKAIGFDFSCIDTGTMGNLSAAMRLRDSMQFQWDVTGAIASWFDSGSSRLVLVGNQGTPWLAVDVTNGKIYRNGVFVI